MSRIHTHAISLCLLGGGVFAWAFAGQPLVANPNLAAPLNALGINGSPYGEVFAMAIQGPIDTYFNGAMSSGGAHRHDDNCVHDKVSKENEIAKEDKVTVSSNKSLTSRLEGLIASLDKAQKIRTNPRSASEAHRLYLRRQVENKLRFAYQLDPAHYANYTSLHFFLTEPSLGTRPQLTPSAAKLADDTIRYCLKQDKDPRPALTAAAATCNILELMFNDQANAVPKFNTAQMRQYLNLLDHCLARYVAISKEWDQSKNWELLSPQRIFECDERFTFINRIRDVAEGTILRFERKTSAPQAAN